jgi:hypothetical protein
MNDITFNIGQGGLGRIADGDDHWSGMLFEGTKPVAFGTDDIKAYNNIQEAEADGIIATGTTAVIHYHISQFFAQQPNTQLFVGIYTAFSATFQEVRLIQSFAGGKLRQVAVYNTANLVAGAVTALQTIAEALAQEHTPLVVLYGANIPTGTINTLIDLRALTAPRVAVIIGQDGNAKGKALFVSTGKSITCLGTALGVLSLAQVSDNIGWVGKFNLLKDDELDVASFAEGSLFRNLSQAQLNVLDDKGYISLKKHVGLAGTYFNDTPTAIAKTNDFAYLENQRAMDKARRGIRQFVLPFLNSPLSVNSNGNIKATTVKTIENEAKKPLEAMLGANEISDYSVSINPKQNVLTTSKLVIDIKIVPVGTSRNINVNLGFAVRI